MRRYVQGPLFQDRMAKQTPPKRSTSDAINRMVKIEYVSPILGNIIELIKKNNLKLTTSGDSQ